VAGAADGKPLLHCHAGCSQEAVIEALRERGLWVARAEQATRRRAQGSSQERFVAIYVYHSEDGTQLFEVCRTANKQFPQRRPGAKEWGIDGVRRVLYRLPDLLAADTDAPLFVCEGEKDADRLASLGLVATTSPGGAGKWDDAYNEPLRGRRVCVLPDNDEPGHQHAQQVAGALHGTAVGVRILALPALPEKGDVSDWLDAGGTTEELLHLAEAVPLWEPPPAEHGASLLDDVAALLRRYVVMTDDQTVAVTLWAAHTHSISAADATPYLSITSVEKRSGKSRLLESLELLVARPWLTGRVSAAALVRKVNADQPTLLLDESDAAFNGERDYAEALRGILNNGHRRGGVASMCVGQGANMEVKDFSVFCPKAIAGIGKLPDTIADRSIKIELKRRAPNERVQRFRRKNADRDATHLRERLVAWAAQCIDRLRDAQPDLGDALDDRAADGWEPLIAIADLVGGDWPARARAVAVALSSGAGREDASLGVRLLTSIRVVFEERAAERLSSADLVAALVADEEAPWGDLRGKVLDPRSLSTRLRPFGVRPRNVRLGTAQAKGYERADFEDAWARYLPPSPSPEKPSQASQASQTPDSNLASGTAGTDGTANTGMREETAERAYCRSLAEALDWPRLQFRPAETIIGGEDNWSKFLRKAHNGQVADAIAAMEGVPRSTPG
jgi:hypothetical protein